MQMTCKTFVGCISHAVGCRAPSCASDLSCYRFCREKTCNCCHLAGLAEGVVVVGWGGGVMGSRVPISRENFKRRVFGISVVYLRLTWAHVTDQLSI